MRPLVCATVLCAAWPWMSAPQGCPAPDIPTPLPTRYYYASEDCGGAGAVIVQFDYSAAVGLAWATESQSTMTVKGYGANQSSMQFCARPGAAGAAQLQLRVAVDRQHSVYTPVLVRIRKTGSSPATVYIEPVPGG